MSHLINKLVLLRSEEDRYYETKTCLEKALSYSTNHKLNEKINDTIKQTKILMEETRKRIELLEFELCKESVEVQLTCKI